MWTWFSRAMLILTCGLCATTMILAANREAITITNSSVQGHVVNVTGVLGSKRLQLSCSLSVPRCRVAEPGSYWMIRMRAGKGIYMDCQNVEIFRRTDSARDEQTVGEYCLLDDSTRQP
jgi:hypothetical protein